MIGVMEDPVLLLLRLPRASAKWTIRCSLKRNVLDLILEGFQLIIVQVEIPPLFDHVDSNQTYVSFSLGAP
jgi:hypothetical protein